MTPEYNQQMYDAIWGDWKPSGNSYDRRKKRRVRMRRIVAAGKLVEFQMEHFFDETPFQRRIRELSTNK
jgi:hypothetical protein